MARKREDKASQEASGNSHKGQNRKSSPGKDKHYSSLKQQLVAMKLTLREIPGDGNCLFGALADQLDGTPKTHNKHRQEVVSYMRNHREDFEPFVEDDIPFERHLSNLAELGTYGGNECIVAFARLNKVRVVIHQLNTPLWQIDGSEGKENIRELHISYHNGDHYNSIRKTGDCTGNPTNFKLTMQETVNGDTNKKDEKYNFNKNDESYRLPLPYCFEDEDPSCIQTYSEESLTPSLQLQECIMEIMNRTGCSDADMINKFLIANDHDVPETIDCILNYLYERKEEENSSTISPLWAQNGTGTRILGVDLMESEICEKKEKRTQQEKIQERLKSSAHLSIARRKELKKQLRKQQGIERKKQEKKCNGDDDFSGCENSDDFGEAIIVKDLGCLYI